MHGVDQSPGERDCCMLQHCFWITLWSYASPSQYLKRQYCSPFLNAGARLCPPFVPRRSSHQCVFNSGFDGRGSLSSASIKDLCLEVCCGATGEAHRGGIKFAESAACPEQNLLWNKRSIFWLERLFPKKAFPLVLIQIK